MLKRLSTIMVKTSDLKRVLCEGYEWPLFKRFRLCDGYLIFVDPHGQLNWSFS